MPIVSSIPIAIFYYILLFLGTIVCIIVLFMGNGDITNIFGYFFISGTGLVCHLILVGDLFDNQDIDYPYRTYICIILIGVFFYLVAIFYGLFIILLLFYQVSKSTFAFFNFISFAILWILVISVSLYSIFIYSVKEEEKLRDRLIEKKRRARQKKKELRDKMEEYLQWKAREKPDQQS